MNLLVSLFLWGCILPVLPILYCSMRNEIKFKKNIVVGVTLPYEARNNADVMYRLDQYKRELKKVFLLLLAIAIPCTMIQSMSATLFIWGAWLILMLVLPNIPYAKCNRDLKEIKRANGWSHQSRDVLWIDTNAIPKDKWYSPWLFAPAVLLCLLPLIWDRDMIALYVIDAVSAFGCWIGYRYLYRNRAEIVDADQDLTQVLSHIRRRNWGKVWLYCAYFLSMINLSVWLLVNHIAFGLILILLLSLLLVYTAGRIELSTRRMQEKLTAESGKEWYADEDDKWIWGLFYYNPNDRRMMINSRVGVNSTVNLARPGGKIFAGFVAVILLSLPFMGFLLDGIGSKPLDLQITESIVVSSYGNSFYEVKIEKIDNVELLDALPEGLARIGGTGAEHLLKGRFRATGHGNLTLCLDPQYPPFLLIKTTDDLQFLFGTRDPAITEDLFTLLSNY